MKDAAAYADGNLYFSRTSIFVNMLWVGRYLNSGSISSDVARPDLSCRLLILIASIVALKCVLGPNLEGLQGPVEKGLMREHVKELFPLVPQGILVRVREPKLDVEMVEPELGSAPRVPVRLNVLEIDPIGFQQVSKRGPDLCGNQNFTARSC